MRRNNSSAGIFNIVARYDNARDVNVYGHNICVLNAGDSLYAFQATAHSAKCVLTFELIPTN
jgi:hypothetical protein